MKARRIAWFLIALSSTTPAAADVCDERTAIDLPTSFPFETISILRLDTDFDGDFDVRSSGMVVGPHMVLTCAHCVYSRASGGFLAGDYFIGPASYEAGGVSVYPYGMRVAVEKRTNAKYTDPNFLATWEVDYGSLGFVCPFEELTTYVPLVFDFSPGAVNMAGYPTDFLPDPSRDLDQWHAAGPVEGTYDRYLQYDPRSTDGASGGPVWYYADGWRAVVAVNQGTSGCNGYGTRLVWQNMNLILDWLAWEPTLGQRIEARCGVLPAPLPLAGLLDFFDEHPDQLMSARDLLLGAPGHGGGMPRLGVVQVIENLTYAWLEHDVDPARPAAGRYLELLQPEHRVLSVFEARALLTASRRWVGQPPSGEYRVTRPISHEPGLPQPVEGLRAPSGDLSEDQAALSSP